jgi:hypothetical protein
MKKLLLLLTVLVGMNCYSQISIDMSGNFTVSGFSGMWWNYQYKPTNSSTFTMSPIVQNSNAALVKLNPFISWDFQTRYYSMFGQPGNWGNTIPVNGAYSGISHTVGYSYNFDGNDIAEGWRGYRLQNTTSNSQSNIEETTSETHNDSPQALYMGWASSSYQVMVVSPKITDLSTDKKFSIYAQGYQGNATIQLGTITDPYDPTTFHMLKSVTFPGTGYVKVDVFLNNYVSNDQYIAIKSTGNYATVYLDDFSYEQSVNCYDVTNFTTSNLTEHSVQVNFDAPGQNAWELSVKNMITGQTETSIINQNPYVITGLSGNTAYEVKLRASCAPGLYSNATQTIAFTTPCANLTPGYYSSFDDYPYLDPCWSKIVTNTTYNATLTTSTTIPAASGTKYISFNGTSNSTYKTILVTPYVAELDSNKRIRFKLLDNKRDDFLKFPFTIGTLSNPADASTFTPLVTLNPLDINPLGIFEFNSFWQQYIINLSDYTIPAGNHYIGFKIEPNPLAYSIEQRIIFDDFYFEDVQQCTEPTNLQVVKYEHDFAALSWSSTSSSVSWQVEYGPIGHEPGTGIIVDASASPFILNNLVPDTEYNFYVRSVCSSGSSNWSYKGYFKTRCSGITVDYTTSFENDNFDSNAGCWRRLTPQIRDYFYKPSVFLGMFTGTQFVNITAHTGTKHIGMSGRASSPQTDEQNKTILVTPRLIDFDNAKQLSFWAYCPTNAYSTLQGIVVGTLSDPNDYSTFVPVQTFTAPYSLGAWRKYTVDFSGYNGTNKYVGIKQISSNGDYYLAFDDFEYTTNPCRKPTTLTAAQSGQTSATLAWSSNVPTDGSTTWQIEYGEQGFTPGTGTVITVNANPYVLTGVLTYKKYQFRVRNICSNNFVQWSDLYAFRISCSYNAPFYETFDQYDAEQNNNINGLGIPNFCWTTNNPFRGGAALYYMNNINSSPNSGFVQSYDNVDGTIISPYLPDFDSNKRIKFWAKTQSQDYLGVQTFLIIGTVRNPVDESTFETYQTIPLSGVPETGKEFSVDFSQYTGINKHFAFRIGTQSNDNGWLGSTVYIDNVYYDSIPACYEPLNITFQNTNSNSTIIRWENQPTAQSIRIEYGLTGFTPGTGTILNTGLTEIAINGLQESSNYDFYFTTNCASGQSLLIGPKKVTTPCPIVPLPWSENLNNLPQYGLNVLPSCFKTITGSGYITAYNAPLDLTWTNQYDYDHILRGFDDDSYIRLAQNFATEFMTPQFNMIAGTTYKLGVKVRKAYEYAGLGVYASVGRSQEDYAMEADLNPVGTVSEYQYQDMFFYFTPIVNGDYGYKFRFAAGGALDLIIDNFSIDEGYNGVINTARIFNFSGGVSNDLVLEKTQTVSIDLIDQSTANAALRMSGSVSGNFDASGDKWESNQNEISKVNFKANIGALPALYLQFTLRQTYNQNPQESAFRVVANGIVLGNEIYPVTANQDEYTVYQYDLSQFIGQDLRISLQHLGRSSSGSGDNAYLQNITLTQNALNIGSNEINNLRIYPNPTKNIIHVSCDELITGYKICNISGQKLQEMKTNFNEENIDISNYANGIYFITIQANDKNKVVKIIKE